MAKRRTSTSKHHKDHDLFVRGILSLNELVVKLLCYALDKDILPYINFATLKPLPDAHIDKRLGITYSDSVHECAFNVEALPEHLRNLPNALRFRFVFIWEAKSQKETLPIDFQIGGYDDNIRRRDFKRKNNDDPLSIVVPILLYHGVEKWEKKRLYDYFKPYLPDVLLAYIPQEKYTIIDIQAMSDLEIEEAIDLGELRAAFIALKHGHDKEYFKQNIKKVFNFVKSIPTKELLEMYVQMLMEYMQRRSELESDKFKELVEQSKDEKMGTTVKTIFEEAREQGMEQGLAQGKNIGIEQGKNIGLEQGKNIGIEQGKNIGIETMLKAIELLKTGKSNTEIANELNISESYVKKLRQEINSISKS